MIVSDVLNRFVRVAGKLLTVKSAIIIFAMTVLKDTVIDVILTVSIAASVVVKNTKAMGTAVSVIIIIVVPRAKEITNCM